MRIEKTETVELLDWEKENGLEIVIKNWSIGYMATIESAWLNAVISSEIISYGETIDDTLRELASTLSFKQIYKYPKQFLKYSSALNDSITINIPLLVHTKLVEPNQYYYDKRSKLSFKEIFDKSNSEMNDFFDELNKMESFKGCFKTEKQPPIDAEGWEKCRINEFDYKSTRYLDDEGKPVLLQIDAPAPYRSDFKGIDISIFMQPGIVNILCFTKEIFHSFWDRANLMKYDTYQTQCFKIANYICSRLCDKIEK